MKTLQQKLKKRQQNFSRPVFFDLAKAKDKKKMELLLNEHPEISVTDTYQEQLEELHAMQHPEYMKEPAYGTLEFRKHLRTLQRQKPLYQQGLWVFFPWLNHIIHILTESDFFFVRTSRNQHLITPEEQKQFYAATIGIGGLSVGSSVAMAIILQGGGRHIKIADFDRLALSNTNRIRAGVQTLGLPKTTNTARQIYEINPYANVEIFPEGLTEKNLNKFMQGLTVVVDELDTISMKIRLRTAAKKTRLPVVMGADNGNCAVIDIERYDLDPTLEPFHGRIGTLTASQVEKLDKFGTGRLIAQLIGPENHESRMLNSLLEMGKSIVSWPQLGGTAMLNGAAVAYCVRKIATKQTISTDRTLISFEQLMNPEYGSNGERQVRKQTAESFKKIFKL